MVRIVFLFTLFFLIALFFLSLCLTSVEEWGGFDALQFQRLHTSLCFFSFLTPIALKTENASHRVGAPSNGDKWLRRGHSIVFD